MLGSTYDSETGNLFTGSIPAELCALTDLISINLDLNLLTGTISECIGTSLTNLAHFAVGSNSLEGTIPTSFQHLTLLENVDVYDNNFNGTFPGDWIENLTRLQALNFFNNNFSGGLPSALSSLTDLALLSGATNNFTGPLPELGNQPRLFLVDLSFNQLTGTVPDSFSTLPSLGKWLYVEPRTRVAPFQNVPLSAFFCFFSFSRCTC
jgi:hypothetical protein